MISKSTYEVLHCPWIKKEDRPVTKKPPKWQKQESITIEDVVMWEQIYHQPGHVGIYIAWSPMEEFYLIVYDMFSKIPAGVKTFSGPNAVFEVLNIAKKLDIDLPINRIPV